MVTTRPPKTIVKPTALGPVANTDTKLLIYGLFQKGRVLAQDGELRSANREMSRAACEGRRARRTICTIRALHLGLAHRRTLKLLIYRPFQKGRVLAQDGVSENFSTCTPFPRSFLKIDLVLQDSAAH